MITLYDSMLISQDCRIRSEGSHFMSSASRKVRRSDTSPSLPAVSASPSRHMPSCLPTTPSCLPSTPVHSSQRVLRVPPISPIRTPKTPSERPAGPSALCSPVRRQSFPGASSPRTHAPRCSWGRKMAGPARANPAFSNTEYSPSVNMTRPRRVHSLTTPTRSNTPSKELSLAAPSKNSRIISERSSPQALQQPSANPSRRSSAADTGEPFPPSQAPQRPEKSAHRVKSAADMGEPSPPSPAPQQAEKTNSKLCSSVDMAESATSSQTHQQAENPANDVGNSADTGELPPPSPASQQAEKPPDGVSCPVEQADSSSRCFAAATVTRQASAPTRRSQVICQSAEAVGLALPSQSIARSCPTRPFSAPTTPSKKWASERGCVSAPSKQCDYETEDDAALLPRASIEHDDNCRRGELQLEAAEESLPSAALSVSTGPSMFPKDHVLFADEGRPPSPCHPDAESLATQAQSDTAEQPPALSPLPTTNAPTSEEHIAKGLDDQKSPKSSCPAPSACTLRVPMPETRLSRSWGPQAEQALCFADGEDNTPHSLTRIAMLSLLSQLPRPVHAMLLLLRLELTEELELLLLHYTAHAVRQQMDGFFMGKQAAQRWGSLASVLSNLEGGESEMAVDASSLSDWEAARTAIRALRRLPSDHALRLLAGCGQTTLLLLLVVDPQLGRGLATGEAPSVASVELDDISRHIYTRWVLASGAWLQARWHRQLEFEADDDKLGLYLDTEEWPTAIMSELPLEGTAVDSDAFGTRLPGLLWKLVHSVHALLQPLAPFDSAELCPVALPPLAIAELWRGTPQSVFERRDPTTLAMELQSLEAGREMEAGSGSNHERHVDGDREDCPGRALLHTLLEQAETCRLESICALDLSGVALEDCSALPSELAADDSHDINDSSSLLTQPPSSLPAASETLRRVVRSFVGLQSLRLCGQPLDRCTLVAIGGSLPKLKLLALGGCTGVDDEGVRALIDAMTSDTIHQIRRSERRGSGSMIRLFEPPVLHEPTFIQAPALTHLELRNLVELTDDAIEAVAEGLGGMRDLSLYGCRRLTGRALSALSGFGCPNLKWLNHNGAYKINDAAVQCLLGSHPKLLLYNQPGLFGTLEHGSESSWCAEQDIAS